MSRGEGDAIERAKGEASESRRGGPAGESRRGGSASELSQLSFLSLAHSSQLTQVKLSQFATPKIP